MLFKASVLAAILAAIQVQALPSAANNAIDLSDPGFKLIETQKTEEGTLTIYAADPKSPGAGAGTTTTNDDDAAAAQLTRRCGSNAVTCDGRHVPAYNTCEALVNSMRGSSKVLANKPRSVCLSRSGKDCCISWSRDIGSVKQADLYNAADKMLHSCVLEVKSGKARDVSINGQCLDQCLSDRASGC